MSDATARERVFDASRESFGRPTLRGELGPGVRFHPEYWSEVSLDMESAWRPRRDAVRMVSVTSCCLRRSLVRFDLVNFDELPELRLYASRLKADVCTGRDTDADAREVESRKARLDAAESFMLLRSCRLLCSDR